MTKINRRDYLIGMGATAAGVMAGVGELDVLAQKPGSRRRLQTPRKLVPKPKPSQGSDEPATWAEKPSLWQHQWPDTIPTYNQNEVVKLIFYGQNGFSSRMNGRFCDVGFHSSGDGGHRHRLSIGAYDQAYSSQRCHAVFTSDPPSPAPHINVERLALEIDPNDVSTRDARFRNGVYFFQPNYANPNLSRRTLEHPKDFRWLIDFESEYLYGKFLPAHDKKLPKVSGIYSPTFSVPYGLFFTVHRTASTFRGQTKKGQNVSDLGHVADLVEANIYLKPGGTVNLKVNGTSYAVRAPGEIYFFNMCYRSTDYLLACETEPHNLDEKEKRSDFFLNYKAFRRGSAREYELFLAENFELDEEEDLGLVCSETFSRAFSSQRMHLPTSRHTAMRHMAVMTVTDESPCAGVGYSGGGGIPPHPET